MRIISRKNGHDSNNSLHDSLTELISEMLLDIGVMTIFWSLTTLFGRNVQVKMMKETYLYIAT